MVRRSTPQYKTDDLAFPIRIKIAVPGMGLGDLYNEIHDWLRGNFSRWDYAVHSVSGIGGSAMGIYFSSFDQAQKFMIAFEGVELADGTRTQSYRQHGVSRPLPDE